MKKKIIKTIKKMKKFLRVKLMQLLNLLYIAIYKLNDNQILFLSDVRDELGGNLKEMYDYIDDNKYKKVILLKGDRRIRRSYKDKFKLVKYLATSKYILLDDFSNSISIMIPRKNQEIIQLWHGPGAFKKMGFSRSDRKETFLSKYNNHHNYTKVVVTSESIRWCFAEAFRVDKEKVKALGYPRMDCLFNNEYKNKIKKDFFKLYPELKNKKIILFAPTYRGSNLKKAYYDFSKIDFTTIKKELGNDYAFIFKWHPAVYNNIMRGEIDDYSIEIDNKFYYDFSNERDVNDLLIVCDIMITDYSSVIFDYALLNKPIIYFTYDLDTYEENRGLYYPFDDYVYGKVCKSTIGLLNAIKREEMYVKKREKFLEQFLSACDGESTKKVYNEIFKKDQQ